MESSRFGDRALWPDGETTGNNTLHMAFGYWRLPWIDLLYRAQFSLQHI
jgi:hypothetical protein